MALNLIQKLCFTFLLLLPILDAYRPALEPNYFSDNHTDNNPINDNHNEIAQNNQSDIHLSFSISQFDFVLIICIIIYILYLFYKRRLTLISALQILSNRFPRLTPLLFIAHLVHQEVSRNDDSVTVESQQHPESNRSSTSSSPPTQLMAVDTIDVSINEVRDDTYIENEQSIINIEEREVWYDCRPYTMAQEEESLQQVVAIHSNLADSEDQTSSIRCSFEEK